MEQTRTESDATGPLAAPGPVITRPPAKQTFRRADLSHLDQVMEAERAPLGIRWWVLPLALMLCAGQSVLSLLFETHGSIYLIATQISVIAFAFLFLLALGVNPLLRVTRLVRPLSRAELMAIFAALFVSGGISSFGLVDQLLPLIPTPFYDQWNTPQSGWGRDILPNLNPALYITDPQVIDLYRTGVAPGESVWKAIPWAAWAKPIGFWMIFVVAMYGLFYCLAGLFYNSWAHREKLVFPLARLPEEALPEEGQPAGAIPPTLKTAFFWLGFLLVFIWLSYNGACQAGWIRGLTPVKLGMDRYELRALLANSVFAGIADGGRYYLMFLFIFTAVGIGYLLPLEVSFSLWAYYGVALAMEMMAIWLAITASVGTFQAQLMVDTCFVTSLGAGALFAFSAIQVGKLVLERKSMPVKSRGLRGFLQRLGPSGVGAILCLAVVLGWLKWNHIGVAWGALFLGILILMTIGFMRIVAEAGVYWVQTMTGPSHLTNLLAPGAVPASVLAPLMPITSIFFYDTKTFIAPGMFNSFKMQEETRAANRRFHLIVAAGILVTVAAGMVTLLYLVYSVGANRASSWFFTAGPKSLVAATQRLIGGATQAGAGHNAWFYLIGAAWVVLSVAMRRKFFSWWHPIGLIMLVCPLVTQLSFSFFIGWLCKKLTVKYGGRHMFAKLKPLFIGLIFGELVACFLWAVLKQWLDLDHVAIDINRASP